MDATSPIPSMTSRRSRYSLYQSFYETAGEESDNSLYYSVLDDEDTESDNKNKENSINRGNVVSSRRSLSAKCLQNQLTHTPRNEFNKRVSINPSFQSTMSPAMTNVTTVGAPSSSFKVDDIQESQMKIESHENLSHSMTSLHLEKPTSIKNMPHVVETQNNSSNDAVTNVDIIIIDDSDQSLNSTIVDISVIQVGATLEAKAEVAVIGIHNDTSKSTVASVSDEHATATDVTSQAANENVVGPSNLPVPKKITITSSDSTNPQVLVSNIPSKSRYRAQSTESFGFPKPKGKTGIPRVSTIGTRSTMLNLKNSSIRTRTSIIPLFSLKCKYCDKSFAKQNILDVHLLEKCEKIPATDHRKIFQSQSNSNSGMVASSKYSKH